MRPLLLPTILLFLGGTVWAWADDGTATEPSAAWQDKIRGLAPDTAPAPSEDPRRILVFSLSTGFKHKVTPHTAAVVEILGDKSGTFETVASDDIEVFRPATLAKYDAVVLNNTCPDREDRDVFRDVLINKLDEYGAGYAGRSLEERESLAQELYNSLVRYVADGGGLIVLHGGIANFNYSDEFSDVVGGSFHYHPAQQEVVLRPVDADHPLLAPFNGKPLIHHDEPYLFNRAYSKMNFHPLLEMDVSNMSTLKQYDEISSMPRYAAWIKPHEKGRVFYCSPSHNPASFENPALLAFMLGGIQYATGDLDCPDEPIGIDNRVRPDHP